MRLSEDNLLIYQDGIYWDFIIDGDLLIFNSVVSVI